MHKIVIVDNDVKYNDVKYIAQITTKTVISYMPGNATMYYTYMYMFRARKPEDTITTVITIIISTSKKGQ